MCACEYVSKGAKRDREIERAWVRRRGWEWSDVKCVCGRSVDRHEALSIGDHINLDRILYFIYRPRIQSSFYTNERLNRPAPTSSDESYSHISQRDPSILYQPHAIKRTFIYRGLPCVYVKSVSAHSCTVQLLYWLDVMKIVFGIELSVHDRAYITAYTNASIIHLSLQHGFECVQHMYKRAS